MQGRERLNLRAVWLLFRKGGSGERETCWTDKVMNGGNVFQCITLLTTAGNNFWVLDRWSLNSISTRNSTSLSWILCLNSRPVTICVQPQQIHGGIDRYHTALSHLDKINPQSTWPCCCSSFNCSALLLLDHADHL